MISEKIGALARTAIRTSLYAGIGLAVAGAASAWAQEKKTQITLGMPVSVMPVLTAYYTSVPMELYWEGEGLDVKIIPVAGANAAAEALAAGQVDVAFGQSEGLFGVLQAHPNANLVAFYALATRFDTVPYVLESSPLKALKDIEGKSVGVIGLSMSHVPLTKALLGRAGGNPEAITFLPIGQGPEAIYAIQNNRVDAINMSDGLIAQIKAAGVPLRALETPGMDLTKIGFNGAMYTTSAYFEKNKETLIRLARGVSKGTIFSKENAEATVRIHWKQFPGTRQRSLSENEALQRDIQQLNARLDNVVAVDGRYGIASAEQIEAYMDLFVSGGRLKAPLKVADFWRPELLDRINDFDPQQVVEQARNWKP